MDAIKYREGYKYQLAEKYVTQTRLRPTKAIKTYYISLTLDGVLTIRRGYAWNGPSGPTWDTKNSIRGSLEHDAKYQLIRLGFLDNDDRFICDKELGEVLQEDGMCRFRIWYWTKGVIRFGRKSTSPSSEPMVLSAP